LVKKNPQWIPDSWHQPILQKAGILAASKQGEAARKFLDFLIGPAGQKIFAKYGFLPVAAPQ
jgi:ABC-type molybdate transport system substrate-binding protein